MPLIVKPDLSKVWCSTGSKASPPEAKIASGWGYEMMPFEWENWIQNRSDVAISHINQRGIPEWDAATEYQAGRSYATGSNGVVYQALTTNTNTNPTVDSGVNWKVAFLSTDGNGNVGIGVSAPDARLHVDGVVRVGPVSPIAAFRGLVLAGATGETFTTNTDKVIHHYGVCAKTFSDSPGAPTVALASYGGIRLYTTGLERLRITSAGNVGVGVDPTTTMHLKSPASTIMQLTLDTTTATNQNAINFSLGGISKGYVGVAGASNQLVTGTVAGDMAIRSDGGLITFSTNYGESVAGFFGGTTWNVTGGMNLGSNLLVNGAAPVGSFGVSTASSGATANGFASVVGGFAATFTGANNSGATIRGVPTGTVGLGTADNVPITFGTNNVERMHIDAAGRVGIGSTPIANSTLTVNSTNLSIAFGAPNGAGSNGGYGEIFANSAIVGWRANTYYNAGDKATVNGYSPNIIMRLDDGTIRFHTSTNGTANALVSLSERMRITSSGNVGVGVDPTTTMHLKSPASTTMQLTLDTTTATNQNAIAFLLGGTSKGFVGVAGASGHLVTGTSAGDMVVRSDGGSIIFSANSGSSVAARISGTTLNVTGGVVTSGNYIGVRTSKTPASATDTGVVGDICWDTNYVYVCVATNTWKRTAITTW